MTLFVAFGLPGTMFSWGTAALNAIAHEAFGECSTVEVETLPQLQEAWRNRTGKAMILTSHYPDADLCEFLMRSSAPYLIFTEDVLDSLAWLIRSTGTRDIAAVRALSASLACIAQMRQHPLLISVQRQKMEAVQIHRILGHLCRSLGVNLSKDGIMRCLEQLGTDLSGPAPSLARIPTFEQSAARLSDRYKAPGDNQDDIAPDLRAIAVDVLRPADGSVVRTPIKQMTWPLQTFLLADRSGENAVSGIELVGRARCVVYGPYFHLPPGEWTAKFSMRIDTEIYGQIFTIEIHNSALLGKIRIRPSKTGSFLAEAQFLVERAKEPVEVRLFTESGAIEGEVAHWSVELVPSVADHRPDNSAVSNTDRPFESDRGDADSPPTASRESKQAATSAVD